MSTKREPLLSDDALLELTYVKEDGRRPSEQVRDFYEEARANDAELIQQLVNAMAYGVLTLQQDALAAAADAGFKPSEQ